MLKVRIDHKRRGAAGVITDALYRILPTNRQVVFLCIGTDRSSGDSLGPMVGTFLRQTGMSNLRGTLHEPVHAENLHRSIAEVKRSYKNPFIVAIDAQLSTSENVGKITVAEGPLEPGGGVGRDLGAVGDAYIAGCVNVGGFMQHFVLMSTRLSLVWSMAEVIAAGIADYYERQAALRTTARMVASAKG